MTALRLSRSCVPRSRSALRRACLRALRSCPAPARTAGSMCSSGTVACPQLGCGDPRAARLSGGLAVRPPERGCTLARLRATTMGASLLRATTAAGRVVMRRVASVRGRSPSLAQEPAVGLPTSRRGAGPLWPLRDAVAAGRGCACGGLAIRCACGLFTAHGKLCWLHAWRHANVTLPGRRRHLSVPSIAGAVRASHGQMAGCAAG